MPAADPQRTWFPEMIEILRARWHVGLPFAELIQLRDELDTMLHRIAAPVSDSTTWVSILVNGVLGVLAPSGNVPVFLRMARCYPDDAT